METLETRTETQDIMTNTDTNLLSTFTTVTGKELEDHIKSLHNSSAPGHDNIHSKTLKQITGHILTPLLHIINKSLNTGIFPSHCKQAIIVPVFKKGSRSLLSNYRPISMLPTISKLIEKSVKLKLDIFLELNNIISSRQFGFRRHWGTEDATLDLTSYIYDELNKNNKVLACFLDISKAYDSIKHDILVRRLYEVGLRGKVLDWFKSYLSERTQQVRLNQKLSNLVTCDSFSIPQGTVLSCTLFNLFINNLPNVTLGKTIMYADDAVICYSADNWTRTHDKATMDLKNVMCWYSKMFLKLNLDKSSYITFSTTSTGQPTYSRLIIHDEHNNTITELSKTTHTRYLGILIDQNLKWTYHIDSLNKKLRHLMYVFSQLRRVCSQPLLRVVYYALAHSLLQYCITSWGGAYQNTITRLKRSQNILLRIALHKPRLFSSDSLYDLFNVPKLTDIYIYNCTLQAHKHCTDWTLTNSRTRQSGQVQIERVNKSLYKRHFTFLGKKLYNILPNEVKVEENPVRLRMLVKLWIEENHHQRFVNEFLN